jgi:hypothetical protein
VISTFFGVKTLFFSSTCFISFENSITLKILIMEFTGQEIGTMYARQLAKNYRDQKLGKQLLTDDTKAVWFSSNVMLQALGLPEDTDTGDISGIRIYFGAYENRDDFPGDPNYRRMLTLILVQTERITESSGKIVHKDILKDKHEAPAYPGTPAAFNDGQICPPPSCDADGLLKF